MGTISENVKYVQDKVEDAASKTGRRGSDITLVAVSKTRDVDMILEASQAGIENFGENYVQEAERKISSIDMELKWHLVGHLQVNKAKKAVSLFHAIETIDSVRIAQEISRRALSVGKRIKVLVQVNVAEEKSKWGVLKNDLVPLLREISILPGIDIVGLMTIPPYSENPDEVREHFVTLRDIQRSVNDLAIEGVVLRDLSMGMSHDYVVAIEEGATIIRVGTAIFGQRRS